MSSAAGVFLLMLAAVVIVSCGKKGPPRLPDAAKLPEISDLSYRLEGGEVVLTWSVPEEAVQDLEGFIIYRSLTSLSEEPCDGCPLVFEKIATVPADAPADPNGHYFYRDPVSEGFRHDYKLGVFREPGGETQDSNRIRFEIQPQP
jgi:hypothetical protein